MPLPCYALRLEAEGTILQDRVRVYEAGDAIVIAVADGAGGVGGSERAAEAVVEGVEKLFGSGVTLDDEATWIECLTEADSLIQRTGTWGLTTAVVLAMSDRWICGASVGDSEAWLATENDFRSLTANQNRKPFLGSGAARPVSFRISDFSGVLIVGTDGLFKYAPAWKISQVAVSRPPETAAQTLLDLVRMPNGGLQDDVGFVVCSLMGSEGPASDQ